MKKFNKIFFPVCAMLFVLAFVLQKTVGLDNALGEFLISAITITAPIGAFIKMFFR